MLKMKIYLKFITLINCLFFINFSYAKITELNKNKELANVITDPVIVEVKQLLSAWTDRERLGTQFPQADFTISGIYLPAGNSLTVKVETLINPTDGAKPMIVLGTPGRDGEEWNLPKFTLNEGVNTIKPQLTGKMVYIRYVSENKTPSGKVRISFENTTEYIKHPLYIQGTTTVNDFINQMKEAPAEVDAIMTDNKYSILVFPSVSILKFLLPGDKQYSPNNIDFLLKLYERIMKISWDGMGLSDSDPNPLHHLPSTDNRLFVTESRVSLGDAVMNAVNYRIMVASSDSQIIKMLSPTELYGNPWGVAHEYGHLMQQNNVKPNSMGEVSVNYYVVNVKEVFDKELGLPPFIRKNKSYWDNMIDKLSHPKDEPNYWESSGDDMFSFFDQLRVIFGNDIFRVLSRIVREQGNQNLDLSNDDGKKYNLLSKLIEITGYDLRYTFEKWGMLKSLNPYYKESINRLIEERNIQPSSYDEVFYLVTPYSTPNPLPVLPLPLQGIKTYTNTDLQPTNELDSKNKYCNYESKTGDFKDTRDGKIYPYKTYGNKDWFMTNLNYADSESIAVPTDLTGQVYGKYYFIASSKNVCPSGWNLSSSSDWQDLIFFVKQNYELNDSQTIASLKCGGDRDKVTDGLWGKGPGSYSEQELINKVGFNMLPAGLYDSNIAGYETKKDELGSGARFKTEYWFVQNFDKYTDVTSRNNRNSRHSSSVRCVRTSVNANNVQSKANFEIEIINENN